MLVSIGQKVQYLVVYGSSDALLTEFNDCVCGMTVLNAKLQSAGLWRHVHLLCTWTCGR